MDILPYCLAYFGGTTSTINDILFINTGNDVFKVCLLDKKRFGEYTIFHQSNNKFWHQQFKARTFNWALFKLFTHSFNKENDIPFITHEDYERFCKDSDKYNKLKETI